MKRKIITLDVVTGTENVASPVELKTIAVDFTEGQSIYPKLRKELSNLPIGMLVNNVGMIPECGRFADVLNEDDLGALVNCNIMSMIRLTHMILPGMKERKRGLILNIGSLLGTGSSPMYTLYGASKVNILHTSFLSIKASYHWFKYLKNGFSWLIHNFKTLNLTFKV